MGTGTLPSSVLTLCALLEKSTFYWEIILQQVIAVFLTIWGQKPVQGSSFRHIVAMSEQADHHNVPEGV